MEKRIGTVLSGALALALIWMEARGLYWGASSRGHMTFESFSSSCTFCVDFGSTYFWADSGDSLDLDYDVTLNRGVAQVWIARITPGNLGDVEARTEIPSSGSGMWHADIRREGWYHLVFDGASTRGVGGYDIEYNNRWTINHTNSLFANLGRWFVRRIG